MRHFEHLERRAPDGIAKDAERLKKVRGEQHADALDFLVYGDEDGRHSKKCIQSPVCSLDYNPRPQANLGPEPEDWYYGTGVGALYGLPDTEAYAHELAFRGWNVRGLS